MRMKIGIGMKARALALLMTALVALGLAQGAAASSLAQAKFPEVKAPTSSQFDITGTIESGGQRITLEGSGAYDAASFKVDLTVTAPDVPSTPESPNSFTGSMIILGDKLYFKLSGLSPGDENKWYVTDLDSLTSGITTMPGMPDSTLADPRLLEAFTVRQEGKETINGAATTRYRIDVDLKKLNQLSGSTDPATTESLENTTMVLYMWVGDADMYVHRVRLDLTSKITGAGLPDADLNMDVSVTFRAFNAPVNIQAPANAEPLDLSSGASPIFPGMPGGNLPIMGMPIGMGGMAGGMPKTGSSDMLAPLSLVALGVLCLAAGMLARRRAYAAR